jgi:hypothetical protein
MERLVPWIAMTLALAFISDPTEKATNTSAAEGIVAGWR